MCVCLYVSFHKHFPFSVLQLLHLQDRISQYDSSSGREVTSVDSKSKVTPSFRSAILQRQFSDYEKSEDDLRTGNFVFVSDDSKLLNISYIL